MEAAMRAMWRDTVIAESDDIQVVDGYSPGGRIAFWRGVKIERGDGEQRPNRLARLLGRS
jgi:hypothetical protein